MLSIADIKNAAKNKVPLVRSSTLNWITFCIETSNKAVILKVHKDYVPILMEVSAFGFINAIFAALLVIEHRTTKLIHVVLTGDLRVRCFFLLNKSFNFISNIEDEKEIPQRARR